MAATYEHQITLIAAVSRLSVFALQVFFNLLIPDHEADVFNPPTNVSQSFPNQIINSLLSGFKRWDAVYFLHISEYGYTYENCLAFFPLFPLTARLISYIFYICLQSILNYSNILLLSSFLLNQYLFVKTAVILYKLGINVLKDEILAYWAAVMFCFNPASIFMSAPYSEILYAFVTFQAMLLSEKEKYLISSIFISLGAFSRSNGIIVVGYVLFPKLIKSILTIMLVKQHFSHKVSIFVKFVLQSFFYIVACALPFLLFQFYAYLLYCTKTVSLYVSDSLMSYGQLRGYKIVGDIPSVWCNNTVAISYSYVQSSHWDVGFLKYYTWKQIPNFLLATPITVLSVSAAVSFAQKNCFNMKFIQKCDKEMSKKKDRDGKKCGYSCPVVFPYMLHMIFLTLFGWLFIHIQVLTRMLTSSCPPLYWYAAHVITSSGTVSAEHNVGQVSSEQRDLTHTIRYLLDWVKFNYKAKIILIYFIFYLVVGTFTFSNFLPWT